MFIEDEHETFKKYLSPPNPIITKTLQEPCKVNLISIPLSKNRNLQSLELMRVKKKEDSNDDSEQQQLEGEDSSLLNCYKEKDLQYKKWENSEMRTRNKRSFFASIFTRNPSGNFIKGPEIKSNGQLVFDSKFQSGNLFAVYRTGQKMYDIILQNDINTMGYTQWYNFTVSNTRKNEIIQFNIINNYKSHSLYNIGMKPLVNSLKSQRGWKRSGFSVFYDANEIRMENHRKKCYHSLTFSYQFQFDDDSVSFAHSFPYTYHHLKQKIKKIQQSPKVFLKNIGMTGMKKSIPMIRISQQKLKKIEKKAIIIMARQHPGQTVGSFLAEQLMNEIIRNNIESQFLLWRYDFYIFPMINIDGVILGNYRGNFYGYDLNRCWEKESPNFQPEVYHIKNQIRKILKKQQIQLILDLHGHSGKMNSFFYGNPFGKDYLMFPFIASKFNPNVSFKDSTFRQEKSEKSSTARVVLGNMIKDTGNVYTYEVSFYGGYKNNKKVHFTIEEYQQLSKNLLATMYKNFSENYKEQKSLKESVFFKEIRKEISETAFNTSDQQSSGSDDEAAILTLKQLNYKSKENSSFKQYQSNKDLLSNNNKEQISHNSVEIQVNEDYFIKSIQPEFHKNQYRKLLYSIKQAPLRRFQNISKSKAQQHLMNQANTKSNVEIVNTDRKEFLMSKLRIFGQTFVESPMKQKNKETKIIQTNQSSLMNQYTGNSQQKTLSPSRNMYRKKKYKNNSVMIKISEQSPKKPIQEIVKINRIDYKKIKRSSVNSNTYLKVRESIITPKFPLI